MQIHSARRNLGPMPQLDSVCGCFQAVCEFGQVLPIPFLNFEPTGVAVLVVPQNAPLFPRICASFLKSDRTFRSLDLQAKVFTLFRNGVCGVAERSVDNEAALF